MSEIDLTILRARALEGNADAQFDLALCYADGDGVHASPETAFRWLLKAAEADHLEAMGAVGRCYLDGGHSHSSDVPNVPTGTTCNSGDMTWAYPRTPLVAPSTTGGAGEGTPTLSPD